VVGFKCAWMDGLVDRRCVNWWIGGWMVGRVDVWMGECVDVWMGECVDG
jgi:hypothetical protein